MTGSVGGERRIGLVSETAAVDRRRIDQANMTNGAEAMVRLLAGHGVRHIFGLCGDTSLPFYDALARLDHGMEAGQRIWKTQRIWSISNDHSKTAC